MMIVATIKKTGLPYQRLANTGYTGRGFAPIVCSAFFVYFDHNDSVGSPSPPRR
jgi:hypothetical protein